MAYTYVPIHNCMHVKVFLVRSNCACRQLFMEKQTKMCGGVCVRVTRVLDKIYGCAYPSLPQTAPTYILRITTLYIFVYIIAECVVGIWRVHNCLWWHLLRKWLALVLIYMIIFTSADSSIRGTGGYLYASAKLNKNVYSLCECDIGNTRWFVCLSALWLTRWRKKKHFLNHKTV